MVIKRNDAYTHHEVLMFFYDDGCDEIEFDDHDGDTRLSRFAL